MGSRAEYTADEIKKAKESIIGKLYEGESLMQVLKKDESLPNRSYVYEWLNEENSRFDKEFANNYARARENSADIDSDKIEGIAQELREDKITPQAARVISDNLKWVAGKKRPKKYGDKIDITSDGEKIKESNINLSIGGNDIELK